MFRSVLLVQATLAVEGSKPQPCTRSGAGLGGIYSLSFSSLCERLRVDAVWVHTDRQTDTPMIQAGFLLIDF